MRRKQPKYRPIFIVQKQHHDGDCAVACLASLLNVRYEEMLVAAAKVQPLVLVEGLVNEEIIKIASLFGRTLEEHVGDEIDYRRSTGILGFKFGAEHIDNNEHAVVLSHGLVFDPADNEVWRVRDYAIAHQIGNVDLLELED